MTTTWSKCIGHLALNVTSLEKAIWFFGTVFEFPIQKFKENQMMVFAGESIMVLKLVEENYININLPQFLDHYGFQAEQKNVVDLFYARVVSFGLEILKQPYDRSDGRGFYFKDPFGYTVEYFWYNRGS